MGCVHKRGEKIGCLGEACVPCMFSSCCSCCCSVSQLKFLIWNWHAIKLAVCQSVWDVEPVEIGHLIVRQTAIRLRCSLYVTATCRTETPKTFSNKLLSPPQAQAFTCMECLESRKKEKR
jgi:hypothetical protein